MKIVDVDSTNIHIYHNLCQAYEGEFSAITGKLPQSDGSFKLDTDISAGSLGVLLYKDESPIGFAAVKTLENRHEICEFYIIPSLRRRSMGKKFVHALFERFKGEWEVKQLTDADSASHFWRKVIDEFTSGNYVEDIYNDKYWGLVVRQRFNSHLAGKD